MSMTWLKGVSEKDYEIALRETIATLSRPPKERTHKDGSLVARFSLVVTDMGIAVKSEWVKPGQDG